MPAMSMPLHWRGPDARSPLAGRVAARLAGTTIVLCTALFLLASGAGLSDPGLQYDELLFVNAALGDSHPYQGFVYRESFGVPTMLMPYIGALKAWVYAPIFAVFGVSVDSVRIPAVLLAALALVLVVLLIYRVLGMWAAIALALLLSTDPVYSAVSRADWGPTVFSALLRVTALLCYFAFLRRRSLRYLWLFVIALSLGLFNKLDYVWFIAAVGIAALVMHNGTLIEVLRRRRAAAVIPVVVLIAVVTAAFFTLILPATRLPLEGSHAALGARISEVGHLFRITVDGTGVYEYMTGSTLKHATLMGSLFPFVLVGCLLVAAWHLIWGRRRTRDDALREAASTTTFFLIVFSVVAVGIVFTKQATGPQHIMLLWPLPAVLAVCLLATAMRIPGMTPRRVVSATLIVVLVALVVTQIRTTASYVHAYRSDRQWNTIWSPEIYAAAHAVDSSATGVERVISADWGLGNQIFALGNEDVRQHFLDPWPSFSSATATPAVLKREWFDVGSVIVIFHTKAGEIMPSTTQNVEAVLKSYGSRVRPIFAGRQIDADLVLG